MSRFCSTWAVAVLSVAALASGAPAADWALPSNAPLLTHWAKEVSTTNALPDYPRPQMVGQRWLNLNGLWNCAVTEHRSEREKEKPAQWDGQILVPYPIESALSGVMKPLNPDQRLWYRRTFRVPNDWAGQRVLLHLGAVDWQATIFLNGRELGGHRDGYDAFTFDITRAPKPDGSNELVVSVWDPTDTSWQLHGKQALKPGGCSYAASPGIWQTVWLEPVPMTTSIEALHAVPDVAAGVLQLTVTGRVGNEPLDLEAPAFAGGTEVASARGRAGFELWPALHENQVKFYKNTGSRFTTNLALTIQEAFRNPTRDKSVWSVRMEATLWPHQVTIGLAKLGPITLTIRRPVARWTP